MYFNDWLSRRALYTSDRVAIVDDTAGRQYTYEELNARASRLAGVLQHSCGVGPGDRVACMSTNRLEYIDLYFACGKIGAVLVPLNFRLPESSIRELLQDCTPRLLIHDREFRQISQAAADASLVPRAVPFQANAGTRPVDGLDTLSAGQIPPTIYAADEDDLAMILYTSGTTGRAKGVMIPWRQVHFNALNTTIGLALSQDDVAFLNMPLHHTGGWHVLFTPLMLLGGRIVLQERFDANRCNSQIGPAGITILFGVPTTLRMMREASNFESADLSRVRYAIFGGESCPLELIEAYQRRGVAMRQGYGLTEAGPNCFSLPAADALRKPGSIGLPNFHVGVRLVTEDGAEADTDQVGELWMKGPHVCGGYWDNPDETNQTIRDGWLRTGDLLQRDAEGYYYVVGRKSQMFISGGENVYPAHVERVLQRHDAVVLAAVLGRPEPTWGETGWAFVQFHPGCAASVDELDAWCRSQLARFQCPTRFFIVDELPVAHTGKVDRRVLQDRLAGMSS